jgi:hypothetical protein
MKELQAPTLHQVYVTRKEIMEQLTAVASELHTGIIVDDDHRDRLERWQADLIIAERALNWVLGKRSTWY